MPNPSTIAAATSASTASALNDGVIADLLVQLYNSPSSASFDVLETDAECSGVCWASKRINNVDVVLLRGSVTLQDWLRDLMAVTLPFSHSTLGPLHPGFMQGMDELYAHVTEKTAGPRIIAGHSLGAARSAILSGLLTLSGHPPLARVAFGEPKPGFRQLASVLANVQTRSYRNGDQLHHDLVTDVPFSFPPEEYVHPNTITQITAPPNDSMRASFGMFAWHHMPLYSQGVSLRVGAKA